MFGICAFLKFLHDWFEFFELICYTKTVINWIVSDFCVLFTLFWLPSPVFVSYSCNLRPFHDGSLLASWCADNNISLALHASLLPAIAPSKLMLKLKGLFNQESDFLIDRNQTVRNRNKIILTVGFLLWWDLNNRNSLFHQCIFCWKLWTVLDLFV